MNTNFPENQILANRLETFRSRITEQFKIFQDNPEQPALLGHVLRTIKKFLKDEEIEPQIFTSSTEITIPKSELYRILREFVEEINSLYNSQNPAVSESELHVQVLEITAQKYHRILGFEE